ncbi:MAG: hypothetical protein WDZ81_00475 [Candidatus Saccharimonadales bacterium]
MLEKLKQPKGGVALALGAAVALLGVLILAMALWAPRDLGPFGITAWFGLLAVSAGLLITTFLYAFKKLFKLGPKETRKPSSIRQGILLSLWAVGLIALNSLRQLGVGDIVLVSVLIVLIEIYIRRNQ